MSFSAVAWLLDDCEVRGTPGWVLLSLCHACDGDGFAALSKRTLARETRMSEAAAARAMTWLTDRGLIADVGPEFAPEWWRAIRADRRPRLVHLVAFTGSRFAPPTCAQPPVETVDNGTAGSQRGRESRGRGVSTGSHATPSDLPVPGANLDQEMNTDTDVSRQPVGKRPPHPDCPTCHGKGESYNAVGGFDMACPCTYEPEWKPPGRATRPPVGFGMPAQRGA